jgi:anti-sigma-K factor RskA
MDISRLVSRPQRVGGRRAAVSTPMKVTADVLQDFLADKLSDEERRHVEQAIKEDRRIAQMVESIRARSDLLRAELELESETPPDWLEIVSRWQSSSGE